MADSDSIGYFDVDYHTARSSCRNQSVVVGPEEVFPAGSEMATRMRAFDWAPRHSGPVSTWPQSLRTSVRILLTSRFAMWMGWGPDLTFFYNDAYARMTLGKKHPWALGRAAREVWAEIWRDIGPRIERVIETGTATWDESLLLFLERSGYVEETYHTFSYSPLTDDATAVAGMLCVVTEETDRVIGARRLASLRELAASLATVTAEADVIEGIRGGIGDNQRDIPFSLLYLYDGDDGDDGGCVRAQLAGATGIEPGIRLPWRKSPWVTTTSPGPRPRSALVPNASSSMIWASDSMASQRVRGTMPPRSGRRRPDRTGRARATRRVPGCRDQPVSPARRGLPRLH